VVVEVEKHICFDSFVEIASDKIDFLLIIFEETIKASSVGALYIHGSRTRELKFLFDGRPHC